MGSWVPESLEAAIDSNCALPAPWILALGVAQPRSWSWAGSWHQAPCRLALNSKAVSFHLPVPHPLLEAAAGQAAKGFCRWLCLSLPEEQCLYYLWGGSFFWSFFHVGSLSYWTDSCLDSLILKSIDAKGHCLCLYLSTLSTELLVVLARLVMFLMWDLICSQSWQKSPLCYPVNIF